ncbi:DNA-(apurinic or apyrimidinic site) lyase 2 [Capsicum chinense]|nr:DNA-(apurinic or apyrimidinic site) lyase 2 [Capsicum chinense]
MKRQRTLIGEEDVEPSPPRFPNDAIVEELPLTGAQASQNSASNQHRQSFFGKSFGQSIFGSSPSYHRFEYRVLEVEEKPWKPREEGSTGLLATSKGYQLRKEECPSIADGLEYFSRDELLKVDSEGLCLITNHGHFVLFNIYGPRVVQNDPERIQFKLTFFRLLEIVDILLDRCLQPDSFYFNVLPFAENAREFHFPSFSHLPSSIHPNVKKQEAADKLVQMLYLAPPEKQEVMPRDFTPNPILEIYIITVADTYIKLLFELGIGMAMVVGFFDQMNVIS